MIWDKSSVKYKIQAMLATSKGASAFNNSAIEKSGILLQPRFSVIGFDFYDVLVMYEAYANYSDISVATDNYFELCRTFVSRHNEVSLCNFIREIMYSEWDLWNECSGYIMFIFMLLMELYGPGTLVSFDGNKVCRKGLSDSDSISFPTLLMYLLAKEKNTKSYNTKRLEKVIESIRKTDRLNYYGEKILNHGSNKFLRFLHEVVPSVMTTALWTPHSHPIDPLLCIYMMGFPIEKKADSSLNTLLDVVMSRSNPGIIKHRRLYLRDKGVVLVPITPIDGVTRIYLTELHTDREHLIYISAMIHNEEQSFVWERRMILSIENIGQFTGLILYEKDFVILFMVFNFLGIVDKLYKSTTDSLQTNPIDSIKDVVNELIDMVFKDIVPSICLTPIRFEDPVWWNYEAYSGGSTSVKAQGPKVLKEIEIGRYVRKLPLGQQASTQAINLAKKVCMELKEGYTIVDEFKRTVNTHSTPLDAKQTSEFS